MPVRRPLGVLALALGLTLSLCAAAGAQLAFSGRTIAGPDASIVSLGNVTLARDGTGAVVYLRSINGATHAFAQTVSGGVWSAAVQLDTGLPGSASQPLVAAANGGRVAAVFISGGTLYGAVHLPGRPGFGGPQPLAQGASTPALAISTFGTAYTSFTAPNGSTSAIYVARLDRASARWLAMPTPLNLVPSDNAGFNAVTRSAIAVASDGEALVSWAETEADGLTHVIARRVSAAGPSTAPQDLNLPSVSGLPGSNADSPSVSIEDASDYAWVAFRQSFLQGGTPVSRTIARHQYGSLFDPPEPVASGFGNRGPTLIDPLTIPTADGADAPQVSVDGSGDGVAAVETTASHGVFADPLADPYFTGPARLDTGTNAILPQPVAAVGGIDALGAVAWLQAPAAGAPAAVEVRAYVAPTFQPLATISSTQLGGVQIGPGALSADADQHGDSFVAWLQGAPTASRIMVGGIAAPPQSFHLVLPAKTTDRRQAIGWTPSSDQLGIADYVVYVDGIPIGTTTATKLIPSAPLPAGNRVIRVVAVNNYGTKTATPAVTLVVAKGKSGAKKP
jgi:hypothetical protein